jgi:hypothetical protein
VSDRNLDALCPVDGFVVVTPCQQAAARNFSLSSSTRMAPKERAVEGSLKTDSLTTKFRCFEMMTENAKQFSRNFLQYKVLRTLRPVRGYAPAVSRINRDIRIGGSLVVKGDALIHGLCLVAWPVGSERRIHRLHHVITHSSLTRRH